MHLFSVVNHVDNFLVDRSTVFSRNSNLIFYCIKSKKNPNGTNLKQHFLPGFDGCDLL